MEVAAAKQLLPVPPRDAINSPSSSSSSSTYSSSSPSPSRQQNHHHPLPPSPKPVPRVIDTAPFATTFVQADTASFKQVVQMLTGSSTPPPPPSQTKPAARNHNHQHHGGGGGHSPVPCRRPKKPAFKLYDRRGLKNLKTIAPLAMAAAGPSSPRKALLSPSVLDFPSLALGSPVTPLVADPFHRSSPASASPSPGEGEAAAERAAIARKGFFLRPSPRSAAEPPRLLPLFPVASPSRMASSSAAAAPSYQ